MSGSILTSVYSHAPETARYEAPTIKLYEDSAQVVNWVWWVVIVGSFSLALAYASYCTYKGGYPSISWGWSGFRIACNR